MKNPIKYSAFLLTTLFASTHLYALDGISSVNEETNISEKEDHHWEEKKDNHPLMTDKRDENTRTYANYTYRRIVHLLKIGSLSEKDGVTFKADHVEVIKIAKAAELTDGSLSTDDEVTVREALDSLNDKINVSLKDAEEGYNSTAILNNEQHRLELRIIAGLKTGRLSKLEASSLRRSLKRLVSLEKRLKKNGELTYKKRDRLMAELHQVRSEMNKALHN